METTQQQTLHEGFTCPNLPKNNFEPLLQTKAYFPVGPYGMLISKCSIRVILLFESENSDICRVDLNLGLRHKWLQRKMSQER